MDNKKPNCIKLAGTEKFTRLLAGLPSTAGMKSGYVILQPGESVGEHTTGEHEEAIIILEGTAELYCSAKLEAVVGKESLIYIPPDMAHNLKNCGQTPLRYVYVVAPAI